MADDSTPTGAQGQAKAQASASAGLAIPPGIQEKFGPLLELIKASESMNNEERQYWINILPIMTAEQLKNLEDILMNEKKQLAAIDEKYSKEVSALGDGVSLETMEKSLKEKRKQRTDQERNAADQEQQKEKDILEQIQSS